MPRVRRRPRVRRGLITTEQWKELILGPYGEGKSAFASDAERKAVWFEHCAELISEWTDGALLWAEEIYGLPVKLSARVFPGN